MKNFDCKRFVNVAKWDVTINRPFYTRMGLLVMAVMLAPVLLHCVINLIASIHLPAGMTLPDNIQTMQQYVTLIMTIVAFVALGYTFHNLLTRQSRIMELTLPASNLERFVWHALVTVVGTQLLMFVGVVLADLLHVVFAMLSHTTDLQSLTSIVYRDYFDFDFDGEKTGMVVAMLMLGLVANSLCVLVNAWRYKYNILWTVILEFVLVTLFAFCLALVMHWLTTYCNDDMKWVRDVPNWLWITLEFLIGGATLLAEWWGAYRLYTRAQVTTRRNP